MAAFFDHNYESFGSFTELAEFLEELQNNPYSFVVRGDLTNESNNHQIRRRLRPKDGIEPTFKAARCRWCCIDVDEIDLPTHLEDFQNNKEAIVAHTTSLLPEQFQDVQCWYQFSASMGIKKGKIRLHLWFWLSRSCSDAEMKGWLQSAPVDLALFNPVQPHFTAKPILIGDAEDPMPERSGIYKPSDVDTVSVPAEITPYIRASRNYHAAMNKLGLLDEQQVVRDSETSLIVDGRERFLLLCSNQAMVQLLKGDEKKNTPLVKDVSELTWQLFTAEADLADGKYSKDRAEFEAARRVAEYENGDFDFVGRVETTYLLPAAEPSFALEPMTKELGLKRLDHELDHFFNNLDKAPKKVLRITMGAGKTHNAVAKLKEHLAKLEDQRIEIYVPRHDLAAEYVEKLAGINAQVIHVQPRINREDEVQSLCKRPAYVKSLETSGVSVYQHACRSQDDERCEHWNDCPYIAQFFSPEIGDALTNQVRIYVHNYLALKRNPLMDDPDLVIIDESFFNALIQVDDIKISDVRQFIRSERLPELGNLLIKALVGEEPLLSMLREAGIRLSHLDEIEWPSPVGSFDSSSNAPIRNGNSAAPASLFRLVEQLKNELRIRDRQQSEAIFLHTGTDGHDYVRVCSRSELDFGEEVPVLMLDATADKQIVSRFFDADVDLVPIDIEQKAYVTQVYDRTGSNHFWQQTSAPIDELVGVLNAWAEFGEKPLCVGSKSLIQRIEDRGGLHSSVQLMNFVALRGSNAASDCTVIFITGRNEPPPLEVDHKARGLFWDDIEPLAHDELGKNNNLPLSLRGFLSSPDNAKQNVGVLARIFSDSRVEAVHQQIREAESVQAIARLRLVHSPKPKRVFLLSNVPLEMQVDDFVQMNDLMPDQLEYELIKTGNIPLTPLGLVTMRQDLAANAEAARKRLKRSKLSDSRRLAALPSLKRHGLVKVTFKAKQEGGRLTMQEHLFLLDEELLTDDKGNRVQATVTNLPIEEWTAFLKSRWPHIEQPISVVLC